MKKAFTLIEVTIVIVIIGILASLAVSSYGPVKEKAADKEAISNLKIIQAAEKLYYIDTVINYYPSSGTVSDIATINQNLGLFLLTGSQRNWNYAVWSIGCAQATRNVTGGRTWRLRINETEPLAGGSCP